MQSTTMNYLQKNCFDNIKIPNQQQKIGKSCVILLNSGRLLNGQNDDLGVLLLVDIFLQLNKPRTQGRLRKGLQIPIDGLTD